MIGLGTTTHCYNDLFEGESNSWIMWNLGKGHRSSDSWDIKFAVIVDQIQRRINTVVFQGNGTSKIAMKYQVANMALWRAATEFTNGFPAPPKSEWLLHRYHHGPHL